MSFEIPLKPSMQQKLSVELGGILYHLQLLWINSPDGGYWSLDISDRDEKPIACGIPLLAGEDLLGQFEYLGIGGISHLFCGTDGNLLVSPKFDDLGVNSHLWWEPIAA